MTGPTKNPPSLQTCVPPPPPPPKKKTADDDEDGSIPQAVHYEPVSGAMDAFVSHNADAAAAAASAGAVGAGRCGERVFVCMCVCRCFLKREEWQGKAMLNTLSSRP